MCRLLRSYPGFSKDFVMDDLPMDEGWAYYAWAIQNDGWMQFSGVRLDGDGYVMQGARALAREAMKSIK